MKIKNILYFFSSIGQRIKHFFVHSIPRPLIYTIPCPKRTTKQLQDRFRELGIPFNVYCFTGGKPQFIPAMKRKYFIFWICYFSTGSKKYDKRLFFSQSQACSYYFCDVIDAYRNWGEYVELDLTDEEKKEIETFDPFAWGFFNGTSKELKTPQIQFHLSPTNASCVPPSAFDCYNKIISSINEKATGFELSIIDVEIIGNDTFVSLHFSRIEDSKVLAEFYKAFTKCNIKSSKYKNVHEYLCIVEKALAEFGFDSIKLADRKIKFSFTYEPYYSKWEKLWDIWRKHIRPLLNFNKAQKNEFGEFCYSNNVAFTITQNAAKYGFPCGPAILVVYKNKALYKKADRDMIKTRIIDEVDFAAESNGVSFNAEDIPVYDIIWKKLDIKQSSDPDFAPLLELRYRV